MKKDLFYGWQSVFSFTLQQLLKSKAVIVSLIMLIVMSTAALPVMSLISGGSEEKKKTETSISELLIVDETELEISKWFEFDGEKFNGVFPENIKYTDESFDDITEKLKNVTKEDENGQACIKISYDKEKSFFKILGTYGAQSRVSKDDVQDISTYIRTDFINQLINQRGISQEQLDYIHAEVETSTEIYTVEVSGGESDEGNKEPNINFGEYGILLAILCVVIMLISTCAEQVAAAVLQEKSSKVVEILLTSVKPLALLVGKILAAFVLSLIYIMGMAGGMYISTIINKAINPDSAGAAQIIAGAMTEGTMGEAATISFQPFMVPLAILLILLGVLFYSVIAALAGACVSRMEELTEGMKLFTGILIIGAYFGMAVVMFDMVSQAPDVMKYIGLYCPLSSPFLTSGYLMIGHASAVTGIVSLAIMVAATAVICWFAATVYESLIYHKGNALKIKDLLMINKRERSSRNEK